MSLVVVDLGAVRSCDLLAGSWPTPRRVGLYQNDPPIDRYLTIGKLDPAEFSGYDGERYIAGWSPAEMNGDRAVSYAQEVVWAFDGGDPTGYVVGYYVVDDDGALLWAERNPAGPVAMVETGQTYKVQPAISAGTRYGGET